MKITDVIKKVDALYPNEYTDAEKLYWAYELSCIIAQTVKESYGKIKAEKSAEGVFTIPPFIKFEDIYKVIADGIEISKIDEMGENEFCSYIDDADEVYIVYKKGVDEYFKNLKNGAVTFIKNDDGTFYFECGGDVNINDILVIYTDGEDKKYIVTDVDFENKKITAKGDLEGEIQTEVYVIKDSETLCGAPYESMYIHYILAKILFNQGDIDGYNRNTEMFQFLLSNYAAYYRQNAPQRNIKYKNWW